jgi:hypothetical protein
MGKILRRVRKKAKKKACLYPNVSYYQPTSEWMITDCDVASAEKVHPETYLDVVKYAQVNDFSAYGIKPKKLQFQTELLKEYYEQQFEIVKVIDKRIIDDYQYVSDGKIYFLPEEKSPEETLRNRILAGINYMLPSSHIEQQNIIAIQELIKEYDRTQNTNALLQAYYLWATQKNKHLIYVERYIQNLTQFIKRIIKLTSGFKLNLRLRFRTLFHFLFKALDDESSANYLLITEHSVINSNQALNKINKWKRKKLLMS